MKKLLVVVDYQNDFVNGALGFAGAEALEAGIASAVQATLDEDGFVLFTRDTHKEDYLATREGQYLPVPHCIQGTAGHRLFGALHAYEHQPPACVAFVNKPTFGSPDIVAAARQLCGGEPDEIGLCGVVTDICVVTNALLLHTGFPNAAVTVWQNLSGSGNRENAAKALDVLRGMGVAVMDY